MKVLMAFGFGQPWWLLLLPVLAWWFWRLGRSGPTAAITHSSTGLLASLGRPRYGGPGQVLRSILFASLALFILALARPRVPQGEQSDPDTGVEIVLAVDCSGSMGTEDFVLGTKKISRRDALLKAISEFVDGRGHDRIGMIGFAKETYLLSPMTTDGNWIKDVFKLVTLKAGTAIGDALVTSVRMFDESQAPSKVIILVTDGENNSGCNPLDAADYAKKKSVRVYALEIVNIGGIKTSNVGAKPLAQVATKTGGQYFQAANTEALVQIYQQIDRMEKSPFEQNKNML
ncbi:MAG: VWA domain-containing protein, partial [Terrimicrobiaceae bacterium]